MLEKHTGNLSIDERIRFDTYFNIIKGYIPGENLEVIGTLDAQEQK